MAKTISGELVLSKENKLRVRFRTKKGGWSDPIPFNRDQLHSVLAAKPENELIGLSVELELSTVTSKPQKIRPVGTAWDDQPITVVSASTPQDQQIEGDFHNPYNFIPAPPRNHLAKDHPLGDSHPVGHGVYLQDRWSGTIAVTLTTVTPLLIPDAAKVKETDDEHKTYPIHVGLDGKPYLPATSIKGMLRSAYEAVTNSRLSVFEKHGDRLTYRMPAKTGSIFPARVEETENGTNLHLRILAESRLENYGYACKLPRYRVGRNLDNRKGEGSAALKYADSNQLPRHGDCVGVKYNKQGVVTEIRRWEDIAANERRSWHQGWVCITGANIKNKKYERVFLLGDTRRFIPVTDSIAALWNDLIKDYREQELFQKSLKERKEAQPSKGLEDYLGDEPGRTGWSRHLHRDADKTLRAGTLCYVELDSDRATALLPVSISRHFFEKSPEELLDDSLKPAPNRESLSPADRVFGWVNQKGKGAYKGQLRIGPVCCESNDAIEDLTQHDAWKNTGGMPLAILGEPKPQQVRFYAAANPNGEALQAGIPKSDGYHNSEHQGLRGRKVYPHHQLPEGYWNPASRDLGVGDRYREYFHPTQEQTTQNRTIEAWIKPQTSFSFKIHVTNLSSVELGALLWLLNLSKNHPNHFHRLGGGKPLGFGSVKLDVNEADTDIRQGHQWKDYYQSLSFQKESEPLNIQRLIQDFEDALKTGYKSNPPPFIQSFLKAAQGFAKPIHTPRITSRPEADTESFKWFVENEKEGRNGGRKLSLPELINDQGLPLQATMQNSNRNR